MLYGTRRITRNGAMAILKANGITPPDELLCAAVYGGEVRQGGVWVAVGSTVNSSVLHPGDFVRGSTRGYVLAALPDNLYSEFIGDRYILVFRGHRSCTQVANEVTRLTRGSSRTINVPDLIELFNTAADLPTRSLRAAHMMLFG